MQKLCGRDEAAGLSQARLAHEVERFQRMRVAELVEETAKELQERGGAEQGDTVNMWCVSAMLPQAAVLWASHGRGSRQRGITFRTRSSRC